MKWLQPQSNSWAAPSDAELAVRTAPRRRPQLLNELFRTFSRRAARGDELPKATHRDQCALRGQHPQCGGSARWEPSSMLTLLSKLLSFALIQATLSQLPVQPFSRSGRHATFDDRVSHDLKFGSKINLALE